MLVGNLLFCFNPKIINANYPFQGYNQHFVPKIKLCIYGWKTRGVKSFVTKSSTYITSKQFSKENYWEERKKFIKETKYFPTSHIIACWEVNIFGKENEKNRGTEGSTLWWAFCEHTFLVLLSSYLSWTREGFPFSGSNTKE